MEYKKTIILGMPMIIANYKGVEISLAEGDDWVSIYSCESKNSRNGEAQEAINIIKKDFSNKRLCGSVPLNPVMEHIYQKCGVDYQAEETPQV